ncbi:hypothetical protein ACP70R_003999 [Stipagrostis hirtigluma subsp. patula]
MDQTHKRIRLTRQMPISITLAGYIWSALPIHGCNELELPRHSGEISGPTSSPAVS